MDAQLCRDLGHALPVWRTHPPPHISLDSLAVAMHCSAPLSPLVEELVGMERRHLCWQRRIPVSAIEEQKLTWLIRELARRHVRCGRRLVYQRLRLEGWSVNQKRVQRIWRKE